MTYTSPVFRCRSCLCLIVLLAVQAHVSAAARQSPSAAQSEALELARRAAAALATGQTALAVELLEKAGRVAPDDARIAFNLGLAYFQNGRYADALKPLQQGLGDPESAGKARFLLGNSYFELGRFAEAAAALEPLRQTPEYGERTLYLLEESYRSGKQAPRAEKAFAELQRRYPDSALLHKLLGTAYDAAGRYQEALAELLAAARVDPALSRINFDVGLLYLKLHQEDSAIHWLEGELSVNPRFAPAWFYRGEIEREANRLAAAADMYRRAIGCAPNYAEAHMALGVTLQALEQDSEAVTELRKAVDLAPNSSRAHFLLARSLARLGRAAEAQAELETSKRLSAEENAGAPAAQSGARPEVKR